MTASPNSTADAVFSGQAGVCTCPICTGLGLSDFSEQVAQSDSPSGLASPASDLPQGTLPLLSSRPGATAKLFLDFNGHLQANWGNWSNVSTPAYDTDGNLGSLSTSEQTAIYQIWQRVAEDYAPFNIDVTTIDPGSQANQVVAQIAIGGNWSDWYGSSAGGVAYVGGFYNGAPNVGYVFEEAMANGNAKYTAEAVSHEAGHLFGLQHQAKWNGTSLAESYHSGTGDWAPIMGVGYYVTRTTWHNGATSAGSTVYQNDLAILAGSNNGFGYVADDYGGTVGTASDLPLSGASVSLTGLIGRSNDLDVFSFSTGGGTVSFTLAVDSYGPNLDAVLELWTSAGSVLTTVAPSSSYGASLSYAVGAGTFYLVARGMGDYGDMGRYTITGNVPAATAAPEITVRLEGTGLSDGQSLDFGSVMMGDSTDRTITVINDGTATLTLSDLDPATLPAGYSLVSNLGNTVLAAGASTAFTLRFAPSAMGSVSGSLSLSNDDGDEGPFDLELQGTGVEACPEISVVRGSTELSSGSSLNFGVTTVGTAVTRTITIRNDGLSLLELSPLDPAELPAGYSLVSNLGATSLAGGEATTLTLRLDASAAGSWSGPITITNSDSDESAFEVNLSGTVNSPFVAHKVIVDNGDAGNVRTGVWVRTAGKGYASDIHSAAKGNGSKFTTWTFTNLPSGEYNVWASWTAANTNASNAPYQLNNGSTSTTVLKNQRFTPTTTAEGTAWGFLSKVVVNQGWVRIRLANNANGTVIADAIRIVQTPPAASRGAAVIAPTSAAFDTADAWVVLASAGQVGQGQPDGLPLPHYTAPPLPSARAAKQLHEQVWNHAEDVSPEMTLLQEAADLLNSLRNSADDDEPTLAWDVVLADLRRS